MFRSSNKWRFLTHTTYNPKEIPRNEIRQLASESYEFFCSAFATANQKRRELCKRDLDIKFHKICDKEYPMSATYTELFGDKLEGDLKDVDAAKKIKLKKVSKSSSFDKRASGFGEKHTRRDQYFHRGSAHSDKPYRSKKQFKPRSEGSKKEKQ